MADLRPRLAFLFALLMAACSSGGVSLEPALDQPLNLKIGETVLLSTEGLQLRLNAVTEDSRCPSDVQCVTAGTASIALMISRTGTTQQVLMLSIPSPDSENYAGFEIRFLDLSPYPISTQVIDPENYVASLVVSRPASAP